MAASETDLTTFFKCLQGEVNRRDFAQALKVAIQLANSHIKTESAIAIANAIVDFTTQPERNNVISIQRNRSACPSCASYQCDGSCPMS
jgi:hypothetical protein